MDGERMRATTVGSAILAMLLLTTGAVEDFTDDMNPARCGYASGVFVHNISVNEYTGTGGAGGLIDWDFYSPGCSLFLGVATDYVTLDLGPGQTADYASVWYKGYGSTAKFHVIGTTGEVLRQNSSNTWQFADTAGANIGEIVEIRLTGMEAAFDDLTVNVVQTCDPCDTNCDGSVNQFDIQAFVDLVGGGAGCSPCAGDTNRDGSVNQFDIQGFVECLGG